MKILILTAYSPESFISGSSKSLLSLLNGIISKKVEVLVVSPIEHKLLYHELDILGVRHETIYYRMASYPRLNSVLNKLLYFPRWLHIIRGYIVSTWKIRKLAKQYSPDIIHTNTSAIPYGYFVARNLKIPHIWHVREYLERDYGLKPIPSRKWLNRAISKSYSISITKDIADYIKKTDNNRIIYNGIARSEDLHFEESKENYFLYVGLLDEAKGIHDIIDAYILFCKQRKYANTNICKLIVVGDGKLHDELQNKVILSGLESVIIFMGGVASDKVKTLMHKALALVVASKAEAFGRVTAEAMFAGCLVIGRNTAGTKEQFDNGLLFSQREIGLRFSSINELASLFNQIMENGVVTYFPMIKAAQDTVAHLYSEEQYVSAIYDFYKYVLHKNKILK